jgi:hypothetical protein
MNFPQIYVQYVYYPSNLSQETASYNCPPAIDAIIPIELTINVESAAPA